MSAYATLGWRWRRQWRRLIALAVIGVGLGAWPGSAWACVGDCNGDGMVTISEIITAVNIALGSAPISDCGAVDTNGDKMVTINELVAAVNNALSSCAPAPTDTATPPGGVTTLSGSCSAPGGHGTHGLKPCDPGTPITVLRCDDRTQCLHQQGMTMVGATTVGDSGAWTVQVATTDASTGLVFQATIANAVVYRALGFGTVGTSARAVQASALLFASVDITPITEAAVQLLDTNGFDNYSDTGAQQVVSAVEQADANLSFEAVMPNMAVMVAVQTATSDPTVMMVLQTARNTATPTPTTTVTSTVTNTATSTATATATQTPSATVPACACIVGDGTPASCTESALDACLPGGLGFQGVVVFQCGGAATIQVSSTKMISADTTIDGGNLITLSGGNAVGIFSVNNGLNFTVQRLAMNNGYALYGAGIFNGAGTLTVLNCTFSGNSTTGGGGAGTAIYSGGPLSVSDSTFSNNNRNVGSGGAIYSTDILSVTSCSFSANLAKTAGGAIYSSYMATIANSTFDGNRAENPGGGVYNLGAMTIVDSTFSHNIANSGNGADSGGGIYNSGSLALTNDTFDRNVASNGGSESIDNNGGTIAITNSTFANGSTASPSTGYEISNNAGSVTLTNTIVAGANGSSCTGTIADGGHNMDTASTCGFTGAGCTDGSGSSFCNVNPLLDSAGLADNGGPTVTLALAPNSPAINAGDESVCSTTTGTAPVNNLDQRGFRRPGGGRMNCSIGAFEAYAMACFDDCPDGATCTTASSCTGGACDGIANACCGQTNDCSDGTICTADAQCQAGMCAAGRCTAQAMCSTSTPTPTP